MSRFSNIVGRLWKVSKIMLALTAVVGLIVLNIVLLKFGESLDIILSADKIEATPTQFEAQTAASKATSIEAEAEGLVLLRNVDETLPLNDEVKKVNVFGWASTAWVSGGSGSGGVAGQTEDLFTALDQANIQYNSELRDMYERFQKGREFDGKGSLNSHDTEFARLYEPSISNQNYYSDQLLSDAQNFSDTALVVIGRKLGESIDAPREMLRKTDDSGLKRALGKHFLQLSPEELELLRYVGSHFNRVIVLINSTNTMELGELETIPGIDSVLLCGATGSYGSEAVVSALWGKINPSGRTVDTYAYDMSTAASWANSGADGEGRYLDAQGLYPADGTNNGNVGVPELYDAPRFVDYQEGIYVGYRWYETADAEGYWKDASNEHGQGYHAIVQYPFGFGLSYTQFSYEIVSRTPKRGSTLGPDDPIQVSVKVTNTGKYAGKDVVQLYYGAPYYAGQIEKPAKVLASFAKTKLLKPGESQELELSLSARQMASYDALDKNNNGFVGWELDPGTYHIYLQKNAHDLLDCPNADASYYLDETQFYPYDEKTQNQIEARFGAADSDTSIAVDGSNTGANINYLTRADFKGSFAHNRDLDRNMADAIASLNLYDAAHAQADDQALLREAQRKGNPLLETIADLKGATSRQSNYALTKQNEISDLAKELAQNYDDERWSGLLRQLSAADMQKLILHGYANSAALPTIAKPKLKDLDGPSQAGSFNQLRYGVGYPNATVLAQSFNTELTRRVAQNIALDGAYLGIDGLYAPGANLHRSPLGGRNYEYFSEDPYLTGTMAAAYVTGAKQAGSYVFLKHVLLNEQDSYRDGLYTWLSEQSLRELYLEPFRLAVQQGGATALMTSYNRIGPVWAGGSKDLLTGVIRDEWGFHGAIITDYADHHSYMNADQMLRAGGDLFMDGVFRDGSFNYEKNSPAFAANIKRATKDILYMWLNARYENEKYNLEAAKTQGMDPLIRPTKISQSSPLLGVCAVLNALCALMLLLKGSKYLRNRKKKRFVWGKIKEGVDPNESSLL